jgi:hypothetical protein
MAAERNKVIVPTLKPQRAKEIDKPAAAPTVSHANSTPSRSPFLMVAVAASLAIIGATLWVWPASAPTEVVAKAPAAFTDEVVSRASGFAAPQIAPQKDFVAEFAIGAVAALRSARPQAIPNEVAAAVPATPSVLIAMVLAAVAEGQTPASIDLMLNEAFVAGKIQVPAALILENGRVDTQTILTAFTTAK